MVFFGHIGITLGGGWAAQAAGRSNRRLAGIAPRTAAAFDKGLDLCWLVVGSMLPDIVDKPLALLLPHSPFHSGRTIGHSLLFVLCLFVIGMLGRSGVRRAFLALSAGSLAHLLLDQMWTMPHSLLWPGLGWGFESFNIGGLASHVIRGLESNPAVYVPEAIGAVITLAFVIQRRLWRFR